LYSYVIKRCFAAYATTGLCGILKMELSRNSGTSTAQMGQVV